MVFANFYFEDFPNFSGLADFWYNFWDKIKCKNDLPDSISATLKRVDTLAFSKYNKLLGTLPIKTCECERLFSSLKSIKTLDRSTMKNGRLNRLKISHREIDFTVSQIIDLFAQKSRRIQLK